MTDATDVATVPPPAPEQTCDVLDAGKVPPNPEGPPPTTPPDQMDALWAKHFAEVKRQNEAEDAADAGLPVEPTNEEKDKINADMTPVEGAEAMGEEGPHPTDAQHNDMKRQRNMTAEFAEGAPPPEPLAEAPWPPESPPAEPVQL